MASKQAIAVDREAHLNRIGAAVAALAEQRGMEIPEFPARGRDQDLLRNRQFAWMADVLEAAVGGQDAPEPPDEGDNTPADGSDADGAQEPLKSEGWEVKTAPKLRKGKAS